ncbi:hypothetical protein FN976_01995 [Caenimonas sedimenti]|uniref:Uncharacterized protein n=1 Tax=Caenimonas sedimenti TaxID=2596921 RepID=A0A562ZWQ5_9BURK|nr:hypothetical protein [Caenimonas sedimenti]TWO73030.1 hypothetical protein FN976_01995 [Caenimonas sedimenti]
MNTPEGITPPTPHLDREEPELRGEDDIPADDGGPSASERSSERASERSGSREERPLRKVERE